MAYQPQDYAGRISLAQKVISAWRENYPQQQFSFCNISDLETMTNELSISFAARNNAVSSLTINSKKLSSTNKKINAAVTILKSYLKDEYGDDASSYYTAYGLVTNYRQRYLLPTDNDERSLKLIELVDKLSQAGNPIANNKKGLAYWQDLKLEHTAGWTNGSSLRSNKSLNVGNTQRLHKEIGQILTKIPTAIKLESTKAELPTKLRSFGFHSETFK
jgi:hypothetical protein